MQTLLAQHSTQLEVIGQIFSGMQVTGWVGPAAEAYSDILDELQLVLNELLNQVETISLEILASAA